MNDLSFHIPSAVPLGTDPSTSNPGAFSHLHLVGNPDWTASFSTNQHVAAARRVPAPPAPVAMGASSARSLAAPAAIDTPMPAAKKGFLSLFYGGSLSTAPSNVMSQQASSVACARASTLSNALDALDTPPRRALPVDAQLSVENISRLDAVEACFPAAPRREPPRPMALGSDTWNAFNSVPLPRRTSAASVRQLAPPASIDSACSRAPKPLWSDLSFTSRFRNSVPTLEAFQNVPPAPILSTQPGSFGLQTPSSTTTLAATSVPVPPKPLTASPLRNDVGSSREKEATGMEQSTHRGSRAVAHPLVPVGEEAPTVVVSGSKPEQEAPVMSAKPADLVPSTANAISSARGAEHSKLAHIEPERISLPRPSEQSSSPLSTEFTKSISSPATRQGQSEEVRTSKNVREFISALFKRDGKDGKDSLTTESKTADEFNALEMVTGSRFAGTKGSQPVDYSSFFSTSSLLDDDCEEDSEENLEKLRRIVGVVMQSAQNNESSGGSQPTGPIRSHSSGGDSTGVFPATMFPSKYAGFFTSYQTTNNNINDSEWMQFARF
ncbi:hypothetical protein JKF63_00161 [Porcisia hertigi]|uniref:Uncharacterized protein n=1 Tax=Porcisia hertigi TaxID=2761500 RepID=A0A836KY36_9TRYP|nr:hypothetical protein JKF63_00161 [Porcisia hertigi]